MKNIAIFLAATAVIFGLLWGGAYSLAGGNPADDGMCPDLTGDKLVRTGDILVVVGAYYTGDDAADIDDDGVVRVADILAVLDNYFETCTYPTPIATAYDYSTAGGPWPEGWDSHEDYADDLHDDGLPNHSNSGGVGSAAIQVGGCEHVPAARLTVHADGHAELSCAPEDWDAITASALGALAGDGEAAGGDDLVCDGATLHNIISARFHAIGALSCDPPETYNTMDLMHNLVDWRYCGWVTNVCIWTHGGVHDARGCSLCTQTVTATNDNVIALAYMGINCFEGMTWHAFMHHLTGKQYTFQTHGAAPAPCR